jgi:hypothetical protein
MTTPNETYLGKIIDTALSVGNLSNPVETILTNTGLLTTNPIPLAGTNSTMPVTLNLSASQILAMQYNPLIINNASATNAIALAPEGNASGSPLAFSLQQILGLTVTGQSSILYLIQVGTPGIIRLSGSSVMIATGAFSLIKVTAGIVGTSSTSTVSVTSFKTQAFFT